MNMTATFSNEMRMKHKISIWNNLADKKTPRLASFIAALLFHAVFFFIGGMILIKAPQYALDRNQGGVDIYLVAAPVPTIFASAPEAQPVDRITQKSEMDIPVSKPVTVNLREVKKLVNTMKESVHRGDGSSALSGENATTVSSSGNGQTKEKPGYLKNPPPAYPYESIQRGQEGLVMLLVSIDRFGHPLKVELKQGSGFYLLDRSAMKAVKKWEFSPARMGALAVDTQITIPVRFRLDDVKKR